MSAQFKLLEMNEDRYTVDSPFYGEKDYTFTFEFTAVNAVWQAHDADSASLVAKPNIWMGEKKHDHYRTEPREGAASERVFSYREGRSFTLVCLNDQLYLMLRIWEEDASGKVSAASRQAKSAVKVATRQVSGKTEPLIFSHKDPCVIKLETKDGVSVVKVWNSEKAGEQPFILADFGEDFKDFFSGFGVFRFNTIPAPVKSGRHSLQLHRVAAWVGNPQPEGENNFRDYLSEKKQVLKRFGYRQLPLERLSAHYPLQGNRWSTFGQNAFASVENRHFAIGAAKGLCFDAFKNKCSIFLRPTGDRGASSSGMLNIALKEEGLSKITTVVTQIGECSQAEAVFAKRRQWLNFKAAVEEIEAFDPSESFVLSPHYKDGSIAAVINTGKLTNRLPQFMKRLAAADFADARRITETMSQLQTALRDDQKKLYVRREKMGLLTVKTSAPENSLAFSLQILRRMNIDASGRALSYEEKLVFSDAQGNDHGLMDLKDFPCFLLLSLSADRKEFSLFAARLDSELATPLTPAFHYKTSATADSGSAQASRTITEVVLALGLGNASLDGPVTISIKDLSLWNTALWQRQGLLGAADKADEDYNVKTLAHLSFSGSFNALLEQYKKSLNV